DCGTLRSTWSIGGISLGSSAWTSPAGRTRSRKSATSTTSNLSWRGVPFTRTRTTSRTSLACCARGSLATSRRLSRTRCQSRRRAPRTSSRSCEPSLPFEIRSR
ncbi:hypothetical protein AAVH_33699, partial [Aphelenchoides avenae]